MTFPDFSLQTYLLPCVQNSLEEYVGKALPQQAQHKQSMRPTVRMATLGMAVAWLTLVAGLGWWMSKRVVGAELDRLAASAEYEAKTTARIMDRLFTEM
jgi:hypothetical protein